MDASRILAALFVALQTAATGNVGAWFSADEYPAEAMRAEEQGRVEFRMAIDATGAVTGCDIVTSSGSTALDATTCAVAMRRGHFTPARDAAGRAIASSVTSRIRWILPTDGPNRFASTSSLTTLDVAEIGTVSSCTNRFDGGRDLPSAVDYCPFAGDPVGLQELKGPLRNQHVSITFQTALVIDGDRPRDEPYRARGTTTISLQRAHVDIAPDGKIAACRVVERQGAAGTDICEQSPYGGSFAPAAKGDARPRGATILIAVSERPLVP